MKIGIYKRCLEELEHSTHPIYKMGAVIFKGSKILSTGYNSFRSSNVPDKYKKFVDTLHAEQHAIYNMENFDKLKNSSILIIRMNMSGNISLSFPCKYCLKSIKYFGIKNIYYTNRKGEIIRQKINQLGY